MSFSHKIANIRQFFLEIMHNSNVSQILAHFSGKQSEINKTLRNKKPKTKQKTIHQTQNERVFEEHC